MEPKKVQKKVERLRERESEREIVTPESNLVWYGSLLIRKWK